MPFRGLRKERTELFLDRSLFSALRQTSNCGGVWPCPRLLVRETFDPHFVLGGRVSISHFSLSFLFASSSDSSLLGGSATPAFAPAFAFAHGIAFSYLAQQLSVAGAMARGGEHICVICLQELLASETYGFPCCWEQGCAGYIHEDCGACLRRGEETGRCPLCRTETRVAARSLDYKTASEAGHGQRRLRAELESLQKEHRAMQLSLASCKESLRLEEEKVRRVEKENAELIICSRKRRDLDVIAACLYRGNPAKRARA